MKCVGVFFILKNSESFFAKNALFTIWYDKSTKTRGETIIADKDGYVITYSANRGHIDYLETLASELGIVLKQYKNIDDLISDAKAQSKENEAKKNMTESDEGCTPGGRDEPPRYIPDKER